jgi:hypothetical protein
MVRSATVVVAAGTSGETARALGSGFFVAPDRVVTCAHVVHGAAPLGILWNGQFRPADVLASVPPAGSGSSVPAPDAAVLAVTGFIPAHPVVPLDDVDPAPTEDLYLYGITRVRTGIPEPDGAVVKYAGRVGARGELYKVTGGLIAGGQSGGPVLNLRTRRVCAMTKQTLDERYPVGGYAIPIADALAVLTTEDLKKANDDCHGDDLSAMRRAQVGFGDLPNLVAAMVDAKRAAPLMEQQLAALGRDRPPIAEAEVSEWIARQLFTLQLDELVTVLVESRPALERSTLDVLQLVAGCLPVSPSPTSYWVPSDAATALRLEWNRDAPRVVRLATEQRETVHLMLRRATYKQVVPLGRTLPYSAEIGADGLPPELVEDLFSCLRRYGVTRDNWAGQRDRILPILRTTSKVIYLDGRLLADGALLSALLGAFGGLRFMIASRAQATAPDDTLLDLRPPIDPTDEGIAIGLLHDVEDQVGEKITIVAA